MGKRKCDELRSKQIHSALTTLFKKLMMGATYADGCPFGYFPYTNIRETSKAEVLRFVPLFEGSSLANLGRSTGKIACSTDSALVALLHKNYAHTVLYYLTSTGLPLYEAEQRYERRAQWYGIVDGNFWHAAIAFLMNTDGYRKDSKWFATILKPGCALEKYQQLVRVQNGRRTSLFYVSLTFIDVLYNLRTKHDGLLLRRGKFTSSEVAEAYSGAYKYRVSLLRQMAQTTMRFPKSVLSTVRDLRA